MNQRVRRCRIGHPQQRFGQAHQRDALVRAKAIGLQESVQPAGLVGPCAFDQPGCNLLCLPMHGAGRRGLAQARGDAGFLVLAIGFAQGLAIDHCWHESRLALVAMETNSLLALQLPVFCAKY